ncbi:olfactory receptor 52E4-like [Gadus chalcogrammus]|uniref:olfactory receptor 52E4-like n=1 Tax=Gadus chalcogrammus TaxID=1042646 RepID=UPI0024C47B32|nr:olfactory receptor 52E4-like [Gadus chalcogrammus]
MDVHYNITYLILGGHVQLSKYRYLYFSITFLLFILIICSNTVVLYVIYVHESLHKPMYIFVAALLMNALFGSITVYPKLLVDLLSATQTISRPACRLQSFLIYLYAGCEFTLLSAMAFDRYVSICRPLQYHSLVRTQTVKLILVLAFCLPICKMGIGIIPSASLRLCKFVLTRITCDNYSLVKAGCGDSSVINAYGLFVMVLSIVPHLIFIVFSYTKILIICLRSSRDFRKGALNTCLPHLVIFLNFTIIVMFEVIQNRIPSGILHIVRLIVSLLYVVIPPLFNPLMYGIKMQEISQRLVALFKQK